MTNQKPNFFPIFDTLPTIEILVTFQFLIVLWYGLHCFKGWRMRGVASYDKVEGRLVVLNFDLWPYEKVSP